MKAPIFIRSLTQEERSQLQAGLRSSDAFVLRRCQILLASARGERVPAIAVQLACNQQTVRNVNAGVILRRNNFDPPLSFAFSY